MANKSSRVVTTGMDCLTYLQPGLEQWGFGYLSNPYHTSLQTQSSDIGVVPIKLRINQKRNRRADLCESMYIYMTIITLGPLSCEAIAIFGLQIK
jgi:hypothetical protein